MFKLAIIIGLYGYSVFILGLKGLLNKPFVLVLSFTFLILITILFKTKLKKNISLLFKFVLSSRKKSYFFIFIIILIFLQVLVNLVGALGPEHSFDALWYHLTLPKLYIQNHTINFFSGWLLYYSAMPKLTEMFYTVTLLFGNEITAKIIHFIFGLLITIAIYNVARNFLDRQKSLLASLIFYTNLVVGWMSITAYVDLSRTFFEFLAFFSFLLFLKNRKIILFIASSVFLGLAISTKLISISSLIIYCGLIAYIYRKNIKKTLSFSLLFILISLVIPLPWFIFSYLHTKNPFYPIFSGYPLDNNMMYLISPWIFFREMWTVFTQAADPINPIYVIILPLIIFVYRKLKTEEKIFIWYSGLSLIVWYFTPRTGGGRFILPYLPVFSIVVMLTVKTIESKLIQVALITLIIIFSFTSITYRAIANSRYLPVIFGQETKTHFLTKHLVFDFGDFYDIDGFFSKTIKKTDKVLIYGIHNLYYINFPFIHESFYKQGDWFNYILVGNDKLPQKYSNWVLIYQNNITHIKLYTFPNSTLIIGSSST